MAETDSLIRFPEGSSLLRVHILNMSSSVEIPRIIFSNARELTLFSISYLEATKLLPLNASF